MFAVGVEFSVLADTIDLVDENDRGAFSRGMLEQLTHALRADSDENFCEVAAMRAKKISVGLTGDGFGQHGFAGSRRANQQDAFREAAAKPLVFCRVAKKIDDLLYFAFRLFDAGDIPKSDNRFFGHMSIAAAADIHLINDQHDHQSGDYKR